MVTLETGWGPSPGGRFCETRPVGAAEDLDHIPAARRTSRHLRAFLQSGTRDLLLSNTVRMHRRLLAAGVPTELHIFEAMPHGDFGGSAPEDRELVAEIRRFEADHLV